MIIESILCLSSLVYQKMSSDKIEPSLAFEYYQRGFESIRHHLGAIEVENRPHGYHAHLLSTNICSVYEIFS